MDIAFYAPLKPPDHPVPSGDRLMAQLLFACLNRTGYRVQLASSLRVFLKNSDDEALLMQLRQQAHLEVQRLSELWTRQGPPAAWFCYHPYYKSPDLLGPALCQRFQIPYITAEASYSARRNTGIWRFTQQHMLASIDQAAVNICLTDRDRQGLQRAAPNATVDSLRPFIDVAGYTARADQQDASHLITVAMMRPGDKLKSYARLAAALERVESTRWTLSIIGSGTARDEVTQLFAGLPAGQIVWHGQLSQPAIAEVLSTGGIYVWPGCGEAYGLAYLEAQACGLPVIAYKTGGVPSVVSDGYSGILTPANNVAAYAKAIDRLLCNSQERSTLAASAACHVRASHSCDSAVETLRSILSQQAGLCR